MKRSILFSGAITAILVGVFSLAYFTAAASNKFPFSGRAIVMANSTVNKTLTVHFTHLNSLARELALGKVVEVSVGQAKIYKKANATSGYTRVTQGNVAVGDEISLNGQVRTDDRFVASKVTVRNRSFIITGTLKTYNFADKQLKVDVATSSYRPNDFKNGTVSMTITSSVKVFNSDKVAMEAQDLTAQDQDVRVEGFVVNSDEFQATKITEL